MQNIADHGTGGRCHHPDAPRDEGQSPFALGCKQPLARQLGLQLFQQLHQRALARQLQRIGHQLIFGTTGIGGELTGGDHLHAVLRVESQLGRASLPEDSVQGRLVILQGQIAVARRRALPARNLAAHPDMAEAILDRALERGR